MKGFNKVAYAVMLFVPVTVFAAGGLTPATDAANSFKVWLYGFLGVCAFIYLMFQGLQVWGNKIQWIEFGHSIGKVAAVGGVLVLCAWAWSLLA